MEGNLLEGFHKPAEVNVESSVFSINFFICILDQFYTKSSAWNKSSMFDFRYVSELHHLFIPFPAIQFDDK